MLNIKILRNIPKWKILIYTLFLIIIIFFISFLLITNFDTITLPKNSVTISVKDQYGNVIKGLKIRFTSGDKNYILDYNEATEVTEKDVNSGDFDLYFEEIPSGYSCEKINDYFSLKNGDKVRLEYVCKKL